MFATNALLLSACLALGSSAAAQVSAGHPQTEPWAQMMRVYEAPFHPYARDASNNRIIINGEAVTLRSPEGLSHHSYRLPSPGENIALRGPRAIAIGNSVNITGAVFSTIVIHQINSGDQNATVVNHHQGRSDDDQPNP